MKTPSFNELKTLVQYFSDELSSAQLQDIQCTEDGLILGFYRFGKEPRTAYLVFDLDIPFPFVGLYLQSPWPHLKKIKPVGLFLNSHGRNLAFNSIRLLEGLGRVVEIQLGPVENQTLIQFRMIPRHTNLIVRKDKKSISWYRLKDLAIQTQSLDLMPAVDEEIRTIPDMMESWLHRRGITKNRGHIAENNSNQSPYEKWKIKKNKDLTKKKKATEAIQSQIHDLINFPWSEIGEHLKTYGMNSLKPEWYQHIDGSQSASKNMQNCFAKAKAAEIKVIGARKRLNLVLEEIDSLSDLSELAFEKALLRSNQKQVVTKKDGRTVEGRYRKLVLENQDENKNLTCYMGKSAQDNVSLLRKAKAWDYWLHLKDYPSAHAIIHRPKSQAIGLNEFIKVAEWLVKESLKEKKSFEGLKFAVVYVECRHVKTIKGDKLGRVTYHEAREMLIAL